MRGVGPKVAALGRPCFACKAGLNGRPYCPTCGNPNDSNGYHYRSVPLDEETRSVKEESEALSGVLSLELGAKYRIEIELSKDRFKTIEGVCLWKQGPFAYFSGEHNIHLLDIKRATKI